MAKKRAMTDADVLIQAAIASAPKSYPNYVFVTQNYDSYLSFRPWTWVQTKALIYVCRQVQKFIETPAVGAYSILVLTLPPQHGKSQSVTETLPSWFLGNNPEKRVILVSYNDDTAKAFMRRNKEKIKRFGPGVFGMQVGEVDTAEEIELSNKRGSLISRGIGSGITGKPGDLILIDDPIKNREQADSELTRESIWNEWNDTIKTRLSAGAKVIIIMTRWHEDDLVGRIIKYENPQNVTVLRLPCEAEENDPLGRPIGAALCPEFGKDDAWLSDFRSGYMRANGSRSWNALFQGRPTSEQGNIVKREWWQYYDKPPDMLRTIISVDAAFKDGEANDYVSIQAWGMYGADAYCLANHTERLDFKRTLDAIRAMKARFPTAYNILIEDKANGSAIINMLRHEIPGIIPIDPQGGKVSRVNAIAPFIESHNVHLPRGAEWLSAFVDEFAAFPNGKHDDQVDACSQALNRFFVVGGVMPKTAAEAQSKQYRFGKKNAVGGGVMDW